MVKLKIVLKFSLKVRSQANYPRILPGEELESCIGESSGTSLLVGRKKEWDKLGEKRKKREIKTKEKLNEEGKRQKIRKENKRNIQDKYTRQKDKKKLKAKKKSATEKERKIENAWSRKRQGKIRDIEKNKKK